MTTPFDPHVAIRELAEMEWECLHGAVLAWDVPGGDAECATCNGTGHIVPFAALRVPCWFDQQKLSGMDPCPGCGVRAPVRYNSHGWVPEPDVEKACWRVFTVIADVVKITRWSPHAFSGRGDMKEAVLRAALAWAKEEKP